MKKKNKCRSVHFVIHFDPELRLFQLRTDLRKNKTLLELIKKKANILGAITYYEKLVFSCYLDKNGDSYTKKIQFNYQHRSDKKQPKAGPT